MPTPNIQVVLQAILSATDNLISPPPYIANFDFGNPTLGATNIFFDPYFQALAGGSAVALPAAKVFLIAVKNQSATAVLTVTVTPFGGAASSVNLGVGGAYIVIDPAETGTGFSALTLTGVGGTVPAMVLAGK
jgi:hypothetical protein